MELQEAADLLKKIIQTNLKAKIYKFGFAEHQGVGDKTASFGLYKSIQTNIKEENWGTIIEISMIQYGKFVDLGRAKGKKMVPIPALIQWIKARGLKGRDKETGRFISNESFAWGIRQNIKKFGIRPNGVEGKGFIDMSITQFLREPKLDELILKYAMNSLDLKLDKIFKDL